MAKTFEMLMKREDHFRKALGAKRDFDGWFATLKVDVLKQEANDNQPFARVSDIAILGAYTSAAQLGLLIDGDECMVQVRGQTHPQIRCEICAKGVVRFAGDAGWYVNSGTIKEGDAIELDQGSGTVHHTPSKLAGNGDPGPTIGYYAVAKRRGGVQMVRFMSLEDAQKRSTGTGAWKKWPDPMGEKSAILTLKKVLYFGDEIENLMSGAGVAVGDDWGIAQAERDAAAEPTHPPRSTRDRVMAQATRDEQDAAAETPAQEPANAGPESPQEEPGGGADFVDGPSNAELGEEAEDAELPI